MESTLRCNTLNCRKEVNIQAVVTTCSHVFCLECANRCRLTTNEQRDHVRICPACDIQLINPDDVVATNLNPTEDYKTSVLSGLSPNIIMECAGRALSFWAYQTTQEILVTQMERIVHEANTEIGNMRNRMDAMKAEQDTVQRKYEELSNAYKEKSRKMLQTQELYDKLKQRAMLEEVQNAASDAVDYTTRAPTNPNRFSDRGETQSQVPLQPSHFSDTQRNGMQNVGVSAGNGNGNGNINMAPPNVRNGNPQPNWAGYSSQGSSHQSQRMQTPSTHRRRLALNNPTPAPRIGIANVQPNINIGTPMPRGNSTGRSPLANLSGNGGFSGYGMSAGLKVSNPTGLINNGAPKSLNRARVAQRPSPTLNYPSNRNPAFGGGDTRGGPPPTDNMFSNNNAYYN